eukprot:scaffold82964_cov45-Phaeocystis_antarctica.AAC.1
MPHAAAGLSLRCLLKQHVQTCGKRCVTRCRWQAVGGPGLGPGLGSRVGVGVRVRAGVGSGFRVWVWVRVSVLKQHVQTRAEAPHAAERPSATSLSPPGYA